MIIFSQLVLSDYNFKFFEALKKEVDDEIIFCGNMTSKNAYDTKRYSFKIKNIRTINIKLFGQILYLQLHFFNYVFFHRKNINCVVLSANPRILSNLPVMLMCRLLGIQIVMWGLSFIRDKPSFQARTYCKFLTIVSKYICYNSVGRAKLIANGFPAEKIEIAQNASTPDPRPLDLGEQAQLELVKKFSERYDKIIVYVGKLEPHKKVLELINQIKTDPELGLLLVGSGSLLEDSSRSDHGNILSIGSVPADALGPFLKRVTVGVLPDLGGLAINTLMYYGVPVVCSISDGGEVDLIDDRKTGLIFNRYDYSDMHAKIRAMISIQINDNAGAIGLSCKNKISQCATEELMAHKFSQFL